MGPYLDWINETIQPTPVQEPTTLKEDLLELRRQAKETSERLDYLIHGIDRAHPKSPGVD